MLNAFSIDVEDYYQVSAFEKFIPRSQWESMESRVVPNTHRILILLDRHNVKATFFVLGWVAWKHPELVRDIATDGHEIASHSFWHRLVYEQTPNEFRDDLQRSRDTIASVTGKPVEAFRAPSFSITKESLWAFDILVEEGFTIDSSVFPTHHDRYGIPNASRHIHHIETHQGHIQEFPPAVVRFARQNIPVGGGGYFRLYPLPLTVRGLRHINRTERPFVFYAHPWEVDPNQPRLGLGSRSSRFRHQVNLATTEKKLDRLLSTFQFSTVTEVLEQQADNSTNAPPGT